MRIHNCAHCSGTNIDPTIITPGHATVICHDCGQVFEVKNTGTIAD